MNIVEKLQCNVHVNPITEPRLQACDRDGFGPWFGKEDENETFLYLKIINIAGKNATNVIMLMKLLLPTSTSLLV